MLVLEITINSFWAANDFTFGIVFGEVFSQQTSIGVGVVTTDNNETIKIQILSVLERGSKLIRCLNLVSSRAY